MTIGILQVDPFPPPDHAGQEVEFIGLMFAELSIIVIMIILMLYIYMKVRDITPIITIYGFSIIFGITCLIFNGLPLTPYFQIFFMIFQTNILLLSALDYQQAKKSKKGI